MNITILGCGRWGTFLAWYFNDIGHNVLLWGRNTSEKMKILEDLRYNDYVSLSDKIRLSTSLAEALEFSDNIVIAIKEQNLRDFMAHITHENYLNKTYILCMKGLESTTCKRLSEVVYEFVGNSAQIAIMVGPGQPSDLVKGIPTCMIVDSSNEEISNKIAKELSSHLIHFVVGRDLIGNEIGAALNKIIGIAGGVLDGLGYTSLKGVLMVMGSREISDIIRALGGVPNSAYGLCCLGDYQASVFSEFSNSVAYGKAIANKKEFLKHTPGVFTAKAVMRLSTEYNVKIPLLSKVSNIICGVEEPVKIVQVLMEYKEGDYNANF